MTSAQAQGVRPPTTSEFMRAICLAGLLLSSCGPAIGSPRLPYTAVAEPWPARPQVITTAIDPGLASLNLPPLAGVTLPATWRELRISGGHGMTLGAEYPMIRIIAQSGRVSGQILFFRAVVAPTGRATRPPRWSARVAKLGRAIDWPTVLRALDVLGISTYEPPTYRTTIMDAGDLVVEVRHGAIYRAYEVNAPHLRSDTVSWRAAQIARVADSLASLTRGHD